MKKNIYISMFVALLGGLTFSGCSDFLDAENKTAGGQTADEYFGKDASTLLTTTYSSLKSIAYIPDIYSRGTDLYIHTRGKSSTVFDTYTIKADDETVKGFYSNVYKTINYANGVISYAAADSKNAYEARFLRAYGYYLLTQHFGAVPYITTYINNAEKNYPRESLENIYKNVIDDLTDLYNNSSLADQDHTGRASKQAVAALLAKFYLAAGWDLDTELVDAAKGTYNKKSTDNFAKAAEWAEKAINGIALTMTFEDKWSPFKEGNAEEIFSVQYDKDNYPGDKSSGGHSMQNNFGGNYDNCTSSGLKNVSSEDHQSEKSMYLFENGDQRFDATFMTTMYNAKKVDGTAEWGTKGYYAYYNVSDKSNLPIALRYFPYYVTEAQAEAEFAANQKQYVRGDNITEVKAAILTLPNVIVYTFKADGSVNKKETQSFEAYNGRVYNGVCVKKFDDAASDQLQSNNDYRDIVLMHVSELYLVAAEAYYMAGDTGKSLAKINQVRSRAGLAALGSFGDYNPQYTTSANFTVNELDLILDERARELYAEGYRWMDLRRTKQLVRYNVEFSDYVTSASDMANKDGQIKWYRPIPTNEISANTGISEEDQNPGY